MKDITAGVREREDANRTREAGHLDEIQGSMAITLKLSRNGAVGFIVWLDLFVNYLEFDGREPATYFTKFDGSLSRPAELRALTTK